MTTGFIGRLAVAGLLVAGTLIFSAQNAAIAGNADPWTVSEVKGKAWVHNGNGWQALKSGETLIAGSRVETGMDGRVMLNRPGDSLAVSPNSRFRIPEASEKNALGKVVQTLGTLLFKVKTRPEDPFNVKTPYLAAVIKGTTFTVSVGSDSAALHVSTGAVQVTSILSGESVLVRPGQTATVNPRQGGKMNLVGRRGGGAKKAETKAGDSGKAEKQAVGATKQGDAAKGRAAPANAGAPANDAKPAQKRNIIPRRLEPGRIDVTRATWGLVQDGKPNAAKARGRSGARGKGPDGPNGGKVTAGAGYALPQAEGFFSPASTRANAPSPVDVGKGVSNGIGNGGVPGNGVGNGGVPGNGVGNGGVPGNGVGNGGVPGNGVPGNGVPGPSADAGNGNGNAYGHDKDKSNGNANGHSK